MAGGERTYEDGHTGRQTEVLKNADFAVLEQALECSAGKDPGKDLMFSSLEVKKPGRAG